MPTPSHPQPCSVCAEPLTEPSVFLGLCRRCVADVAVDTLPGLEKTAGAVVGDDLRPDPGMLGWAGLLDDSTPSVHPHLDTFADEDQHRLRLLWVLAAQVDQLRAQVAEAASATPKN